MEWFSVHLQARAPEDAPPGGVAAAATLMDLLKAHDGIVTATERSWEVTISVQQHTPACAATLGELLIQENATTAGMPAWPAVLLEVTRHDVLKEKLERAGSSTCQAGQ